MQKGVRIWPLATGATKSSSQIGSGSGSAARTISKSGIAASYMARRQPRAFIADREALAKAVASITENMLDVFKPKPVPDEVLKALMRKRTPLRRI
jgi:rhamnose utilization protein RhaD (predicted bifunctional aldolase and dehydrogenase)